MGGTFRLSGVICSQFADSDIQGAMKFLQTPGAHSHNIIELSNSPPSKKIEAVSVHGAVGSLLICILSFVLSHLISRTLAHFLLPAGFRGRVVLPQKVFSSTEMRILI